MRFKRLIKYYILRESLKEIEMNRILDKISKKSKLTKKESTFFDLYNQTSDDKDSMYLSKNAASIRIEEILNKNKVIICDLHDRDGRIGLPILDIKNDFESETCVILMKNEKHKLSDKFLYNIIYDVVGNKYSLQEQGEYFEKIEVKK